MIIQNAVEFNGTIYVSRHRHDFVRIPYGTDDKYYFIDGGNEYRRHNFLNISFPNGEKDWRFFEDNYKNQCRNLAITDEDTITDIKDNLVWGTRGPNGDQPVKYKYIKDLETSHIEAIFDDVENNRYDVSFIHIYIMQLVMRDRYSTLNGCIGKNSAKIDR